MLTESNLGAMFRKARSALDLAETHEIPPTHVMFQLLVAYVEGDDPVLSSAVKGALTKPVSERYDTLERLYDTHFGAATVTEGIERIRSGLASEISDVTSSIARRVDGNLRQAAELRRSLRDLAGMVTREELQLLCRHLVYSGREQLSDTQGLADRLARTQFQLGEMQRELRELKEKSSRDQLTGLQNRAHFMDQLLAHASERTPFCLALINLDQIEETEQVWGRSVRDNILRGFGALIRKHIKGKDLAARIDHATFGVIMPETPIEGARVLADTIRARFAKITWVSQSTEAEIGHQTLSVGIVDLAVADDAEQLLGRAQTRLQRAADQGGNRVDCGQPQMTERHASL